MQHRPLGKTGLQVTPIGLGSGPIMSLSLDEGVRIVQRAVELGITYLDTARSYGESEVMIGHAVHGQREKVVISTKTPARTRDAAWKSIEESLRRLQTDYVDNCHLHGVDGSAELEARIGPGGPLEALIEAKEQGLVRHIGITSHTSRTLIAALERFDFEVILVPMNFVEREPLAELIPLCQRKGVGVTIMKPVATGLLPARTALKWLLNQPISTAVPGPTTLEELELDAAVGAAEDITLTPAEQQQIETLAAELEHVRCRLCRACEPSCPQGISIGDVLGSEVMYDHYRTMGREVFASTPWAVEVMRRDLQHKEQLIAKIASCEGCGKCAGKCPYGLPIVTMLQGMVPGFEDMVRIHRQRIR